MFDLDTVTPLNFLVKHLGSCSLSELNIFLPKKTMVGTTSFSSPGKIPFSLGHLTQRIFFKILLFSSISFMEGRKFLKEKSNFEPFG